MERPESRIGTVGWIGLAAGVAAWDYLAPETLSHAVDRALEHKRHRYLAIGAVAITSAHLLNLIPEKYDPFRYLPSRFPSEVVHGINTLTEEC